MKCFTPSQTHCSYMDPDAVSNLIQKLDNTLAAFRYLPAEPLHYLLVCSGSTSLTFRLLQPPLGPEDLHLGHSIVHVSEAPSSCNPLSLANTSILASREPLSYMRNVSWASGDVVMYCDGSGCGMRSTCAGSAGTLPLFLRRTERFRLSMSPTAALVLYLNWTE